MRMRRRIASTPTSRAARSAGSLTSCIAPIRLTPCRRRVTHRASPQSFTAGVAVTPGRKHRMDRHVRPDAAMKSSSAAGRSRTAELPSEAATNLLVFLRSIPDESACEACAVAYLGLQQLTALKAIRELILTSRILCTYRICALCRERRLCATTRRLRAIPDQPRGG